MKDVHLGKLIKSRIKEVGMTNAEFGRRINTSRQNVTSILKKETFDTGELTRIGEVLDYDFFSYLILDPPANSANATTQPKIVHSSGEPTVKIVIEVPRSRQAEMMKMLFGVNWETDTTDEK